MDSKQNLIRPKRIYRVPKITAWIYPRRIWFGEKAKIYLTFDDGPHPEITPKLLDLLQNHNVKATFFWLGENMERYPELLERAKKEGHTIGFHGFEHLNNRKFSVDEFQENFNRGKDLVTHQLYRPPYGEIKRKFTRILALQNWKIVMWSLMPYDFDPALSTEVLVSVIKDELKEKDIVVLHENDKSKDKIFKATEIVIQLAKEKKWKLTTLI
ncbi:MAG: polysaccharide deacetylase family protein [Brumimicrobium sp.]